MTPESGKATDDWRDLTFEEAAEIVNVALEPANRVITGVSYVVTERRADGSKRVHRGSWFRDGDPTS